MQEPDAFSTLQRPRDGPTKAQTEKLENEMMERVQDKQASAGPVKGIDVTGLADHLAIIYEKLAELEATVEMQGKVIKKQAALLETHGVLLQKQAGAESDPGAEETEKTTAVKGTSEHTEIMHRSLVQMLEKKASRSKGLSAGCDITPPSPSLTSSGIDFDFGSYVCDLKWDFPFIGSGSARIINLDLDFGTWAWPSFIADLNIFSSLSSWLEDMLSKLGQTVSNLPIEMLNSAICSDEDIFLPQTSGRVIHSSSRHSVTAYPWLPKPSGEHQLGLEQQQALMGKKEQCLETTWNVEIDPAIAFAGIAFLPPTLSIRFFFCFNNFKKSLKNGKWNGRVGTEILGSGLSLVNLEIPFKKTLKLMQAHAELSIESGEFETEDLEDESELLAPSVKVHRVVINHGNVSDSAPKDGSKQLVEALSKQGKRFDLLSVDYDNAASGQDARRLDLNLGLLSLNLDAFMENGDLKLGVTFKVGSLIDSKAETTIVDFTGMINGLQCLPEAAKQVLQQVWQTFTETHLPKNA